MREKRAFWHHLNTLESRTSQLVLAPRVLVSSVVARELFLLAPLRVEKLKILNFSLSWRRAESREPRKEPRESNLQLGLREEGMPQGQSARQRGEGEEGGPAELESSVLPEQCWWWR